MRRKDKPLLSMACTKQGARLVEDYMASQNFIKMAEWLPVPNKQKNLDIQAMPYYIFRNYDYPEHIEDKEKREALLLDTRLELRKILTESKQGYVYSFWPDVLTLKEIGDPRDIATYFRLWDDNGVLLSKNIIVLCRQNTNYKIVRYAAHPFFLQGYTLCANGENTFYTKNFANRTQSRYNRDEDFFEILCFLYKKYFHRLHKVYILAKKTDAPHI